MKFLDYLVPFAFRGRSQLRCSSVRAEELKDQLRTVRKERDSYKERAKLAERLLKETKRLYLCDPARCKAILESLSSRMPAVLRKLRELPAAVRSEIDLEDDMIWSSTTESYFGVGMDAARIIANAVEQHLPQRPARILDFPCGHGRVLRWIRAMYPESRLYGCDTQIHGMEFCRTHFGAEPVGASIPPSLPNAVVEQGFDVIWVGSLLTHLPETAFRSFIHQLPDWLSHGGLAIFTTHGESAFKRFTDGADYNVGRPDDAAAARFEKEGFLFFPYRKSADYGISFSHSRHVSQCVSGAGLELLSQDQWVDFHDVCVCRRQHTPALR